jgi:hypothetical protein
MLRILLAILIISGLANCNNPNDKAPSAYHSLADSLKAKDSFWENMLVAKIDSNQLPKIQINFKTQDYSDWKQFWDSLKIAAASKDTMKILGFVNFPFLQNASPSGIDLFARYFIDQIYGLEKCGEPIEAFGSPLQGVDESFKIDSIHYCNHNRMDYYFGKVNGYYKLVEIITPG